MCYRKGEGVHYLYNMLTLYGCKSLTLQTDICHSCKLQRWNTEDDEVREILGQEAECVDGEDN